VIFSSKPFLIFLPIVLLIYHLLRRREHKYRFLLLASWMFYAWWSIGYLWVIILTTMIDYVAAQKIESTTDERIRRRWLWLSIAANLGLLAVFKYTMFVVQNSLAVARWCGFDVPDVVFTIILPLGISFHTFQGISYTVDVYRRSIPAVRSFVDYGLFVAFFPQLVAGPIVRAVEFLPQMKTPPRVTSQQVVDGVHWFLVGLFKKLIIADWLSTFVAPVFANPMNYDSTTQCWAAVAWMAQIYCDFSGYSDMAIGCAKWFGFELPRNFHFPYLATNVADYWRRWHMTLSTWLRDYLFFPLGGSRGSTWFVCRNLMITFVLCGLWHGASWNWLAFGMYHGLLMCAYRIYRNWMGDRRDAGTTLREGTIWQGGTGVPPVPGIVGNARAGLWRVLAIIATLYQLLIGLVLVRCESWDGFWSMERALLGFGSIGQHWVPLWVPMLVMLVVIGHIWSGLRDRVCALLDAPVLVRATAYVGVVLVVMTCGSGTAKPFIYFQF